MHRRSFLFLQGVSSPFFERLGLALRQEGQGVRRINFCGGDRTFWRLNGADDFPLALDHLGSFLSDRFEREGFTDIVLFGDCRPVHVRAKAVAARYGARIHAFEEGYLRPHWITMEDGGVNANSRLPRAPEWYLETARDLPEGPAPAHYDANMWLRAKYDLRFHLATRLQQRRFPGYRSHRPWPFEIEIASWSRRLATLPARRRRAQAMEDRLLNDGRSFYLFALQLDSDAQIRVHSPFKRMEGALEPVIASFARHAPSDSLLVIKNHPLDNGIVPYRRKVNRLARRYAVADRVIFIDGGCIDKLTRAARGVVVVNSTVGLLALQRNRPVIALGEAVYRLPGLTFGGGIDRFWMDGEPADTRLLAAFERCLIHFTQVNGNFYGEAGMKAAADACANRLLAPAAAPAAAVIPFPRRPEPVGADGAEAWPLPAGAGIAGE